MLKLKLPIVILAVFILTFMFGSYIPYQFKTYFYTISLVIKECLTIFLPFLIFTIVFNSMVQLGKNAVIMVGVIYTVIVVSNFCSTNLAYFVGINWIHHWVILGVIEPGVPEMNPVFEIDLPKLLTGDQALFLSVFFGLVMHNFSNNALKLNSVFVKASIFFLNKIFLPIMPVFIFGYLVKMQYESILQDVFTSFLPIVLLFVLSVFIYITVVLGILVKYDYEKFIYYLKNMVPAVISGFTTMSSAASLPLTLLGSEKNVSNPRVAQAGASLSVNVHLLGDCFAIPILALAILSSYGYSLPSYQQYLIFTIFFVYAKFAVAAIPGGGILVMLPILEQYLGFTSEMLSLITALYLLLDPIITVANILGNAVLVIFLDKYRSLNKYISSEEKN